VALERLERDPASLARAEWELTNEIDALLQSGKSKPTN
jgi:hypothetical protein